MPFLQGKSSQAFTAPESPRKVTTFGFSSKLSGPFWKSKSKHSVGSESQGSSSTVSGLGSPPFTPDSSLSIYTNSLDSDCSNSSTTSSSNQISPKQNNSLFKKTKKGGRVSALEDQISSYSYNNDCGRYAANMFYDMGDASSFECRVPIERSRNTSVPATPPFEEDDCVHSYYNNSTFTTFPNPRRRHSIAYSSYSSSLTSNGSSTTKNPREEMIELLPLPSSGLPGPDGYLVPISTNAMSLKKKNKSRNGFSNNVYQNDSVTSAVVEVDVHVADPTTVAMAGSEMSSNSDGHTLTDSSSCTIVRKGFGNKASSNDSDSAATIVPPTDQHDGSGKDSRILYMSRILLATSDCEPFCSLCATSAAITSTKNSSMDVAIIYYRPCYFSGVINEKISMFFEKMVTPENQKIDIALQVYDLKDLDHQSVAAEVHRAKVQIVIISNPFLDWLRHEAASRKKLSPVNRVLRSKRVIAIITGTTAADISTGHQAVLARFNEWFTLELPSASKVDGEFCKQFTDQVVKIYNVEQGTSAGGFSVFPKKVTREQPKVVIMLKKPLEPEDAIRVEVAKGRDVESLKNVTPTNPHTAIIRIPDGLAGEKTALFEITVYVNQQKLGTKLVKYEHVTRTAEEDIIQKMLQALPGFQKLLDDHISQKLAKHFRDSTDWTLDPDLEIMNDALVSRVENLPTLMHFSAYYGLEQTVWTVLNESQDGFEQCEVKNEFNEVPLDIAQGNTEQILKDHQDYCKSFDLMNLLIHENEATGGALLNGIHDDSDLEPSISDLESAADSNGSVDESVSDSTNNNNNSPELDNKSSENSSGGIPVYDVPPAVPSYGVKRGGPVPPVVMSEVDTPPKPAIRKVTPAFDKSYINIIRQQSRNHGNSINNNEPPPTPPPKSTLQQQYIDPNSDIPRSLAPTVSEHYQYPPPARPISPLHFQSSGGGEYLSMDPPPQNGSISDAMSEPTTITPKQCRPCDSEPIVVDQHGRSVPAIVLDYAEKELFDIMQDYKKNLLSMRQLEILFEHWKRRPHVKASNGKRDLQLQQMRREYRKIQQAMSKNNRRPSVLDRVTNIFARKKGINGYHGSNELPPNLNMPSSSSTTLLNRNDGFGSTGFIMPPNGCMSEAPLNRTSESGSLSSCPEVPLRGPAPTWNQDRALATGSYVIPSHALTAISPSTSMSSLQHYINDPKPGRKPPLPHPSESRTPPETPTTEFSNNSPTSSSSIPPPRPAKPIRSKVKYENELFPANGAPKPQIGPKPKSPYVNSP